MNLNQEAAQKIDIRKVRKWKKKELLGGGETTRGVRGILKIAVF